jgi:uncharacterized protein (TIGR02145 family)
MWQRVTFWVAFLLTHAVWSQHLVEDVDGNTYSTVMINGKRWMNENLKVKHLNDGNEIQDIANSSMWSNTGQPAFCLYENDSALLKNGYLYNGLAIRTNKLCPVGWHVPTFLEWQSLIETYGGEQIAGMYLRSSFDVMDFELGFPENELKLNFDGFRKYSGSFEGLAQLGAWWTSSNETNENSTPLLYSVQTTYWNNSLLFWLNTENDGFSVRCVCDEN